MTYNNNLSDFSNRPPPTHTHTHINKNMNKEKQLNKEKKLSFIAREINAKNERNKEEE